MTVPLSTYVVLGLLTERPGSGYEAAAFADRSLRFFWPISRTKVYTELSRLEELGWVTGTAVHQDRYPDKRVYTPTPAGMNALREWLEEPAAPERPRTRDVVVLKTFFGNNMSRQRLAEQLRDYRDQAEKLHTELTTVVDRLGAKEREYPRALRRATARYGVLQAEATMAWTEETRALLDESWPE